MKPITKSAHETAWAKGLRIDSRYAGLRELERSLAIRSLWPEAFQHGRCSSCWIGSPQGRDMRGMRYALRLRVTDGAGAVREFPQGDVSAVLWPMPDAGRLPA